MSFKYYNYYNYMINTSDYLNNIYLNLSKLHSKNSYNIKKTNNKYIFKSKFIPSNINKEILKQKYNYTIKTKNILCNIWCNDLNKTTLNNIFKVLDRFNTIILLFNKLNLDYNKRQFELNYIPTNLKKELPTNGNKILGPNEINSGLSYIYNNIIYIWREEEFDKVFIHELFHCLGFDRFLIEDESLCELSNYYNLKTNINCNEGYNEFCALIYHCCFLKIENPKLNLNKCIKHNLYFTFIQIKKILDYYNIKIFNHNTNFRQNTSVFSYFILKGMYLYYINEFLNILINHTILLYPKNEFKSNLKLFNSKIFNDGNFEISLNSVCNKYKKKMNKSLRMCLI